MSEAAVKKPTVSLDESAIAIAFLINQLTLTAMYSKLSLISCSCFSVGGFRGADALIGFFTTRSCNSLKGKTEL